MPPEPRLSQIGIPETLWADGKEVIKKKPTLGNEPSDEDCSWPPGPPHGDRPRRRFFLVLQGEPALGIFLGILGSSVLGGF